MDPRFRLRLAGLLGCTAFLLLSAPCVQAATPLSQPASLAQDRDDWDRPPDAWNDVQRRGFHEGVRAARDDYRDNRRPDADDRPEFRRPPVPGDLWQAYREGFMRGYNVAMSHMGGPVGPGPMVGERRWDIVPGEFDEVRANGFRHGLEAGRDDFEHRRDPNPARHDAFRHPDIPREQRHAFREGFRRGYQVAWDHMSGGYDRR